MLRRNIFTSFAVFLLVSAAFTLFNTPVLADPLVTTSHVTAATIFSDRALITREAKIHVPAGAHSVTISDLPSGLDESSVRVQGKAAASVKIGTVDIKNIFLNELANAAERDKLAALEAKTDEKSLLEGDIKALETRQDFINRITGNGADSHNVADEAKLDFAPEKWAQAMTLLQNGMAETQRDLVNKHIAVRKVDADIAKLQADLNQVRTTAARQRRDAVINIEAAQDTDLILSLSYQSRGANWQPLYDARLETASGELELEQYGQVSQQTGEDWNDVELTLSTTQPVMGSEMPRLTEWYVGLFQQQFMINANRSFMAAPASAPTMANRDAAASALPLSMMKNVAEIKAEPVQATTQTTEYAAEFKVPGHVTLKSTTDRTKLFIASTKMTAELSAQTTPRLAAQAFLFAKVTNNEDYPLIPGTVAKYRDGVFIGNAALGLMRPKETADLSFGIDDRIKITYKRTLDAIDNPALVVVGDVKVERQYQTKIVSLHKNPVSLSVFEQFPISSSADVTTELLDDKTTAGYKKDPDNRQGVIVWTDTLTMKQEKIYEIGYRVKYPKGKPISGL